MSEEVNERVGTLEVVLGEFIVQTNRSLNRLEREMREFKDEMRGFKDEMRLDRKELNKKWGELANRLGTLAEDIAAPNIRTIALEYFDCSEIDDYGVRRMRRNRHNRKLILEFDVVLSCQDYLFINETKSTADIAYIDTFMEKLSDIFAYFPEHEGKVVVPVFSSLSLSEAMVSYLTERRILAMAMGGETMVLLNLDEVGPLLRKSDSA